jgi:hypothetical protein
MKNVLIQELSNRLALTIAQKDKLRVLWNKRVRDPLAFVPTEKKRGVTKEKAHQVNLSFGEFAGGYLKSVLRRRALLYQLPASQTRTRKILAAGWGKGYDGAYRAAWLKEAYELGLEVWWVDVSDFACKLANRELAKQYAALPLELKKFLSPRVIEEEIRSFLVNSESVGLDLDTVEISYMSRTLGCLDLESAKVVLSQLGTTLRLEADPTKRRAIVLVLALSDDNPNHTCYTSLTLERRWILEKIENGADRPVKACYEACYRYWDQVYTAMTIVAK